MKEIWKDIKDYEGLYQVSNLGRVKNSKTGKILKPALNSGGYLIVCLFKNNKKKMCRIHRLVAEAFLPNPDNLPTVDHINRIRTDNRLENLRWAPYELQCENRNNEPIKEICSKPVEQWTKEGRLVTEYLSITEASSQTGINQTHICECCKGKRKSAGGYIWKYK